MAKTVKVISERGGQSAEAIAAMLKLDVAAVQATLHPPLEPQMVETVQTIAARSGMAAEAIAATLQLDVVAVRAALAAPTGSSAEAGARGDGIGAAGVALEPPSKAAGAGAGVAKNESEKGVAIRPTALKGAKDGAGRDLLPEVLEERRKRIHAAAHAKALQQQQVLYRERFRAINAGGDGGNALLAGLAREREERHGPPAAPPAQPGQPARQPSLPIGLPVEYNQPPIGQPVDVAGALGAMQPGGPPVLARSDSQLARELQQAEYGEDAPPSPRPLAPQPQREPPVLARSDSQLARELQYGEDAPPSPRPLPPQPQREPSWMQNRFLDDGPAGFLDDAESFDALGVLSYTDRNPDGTVGKSRTIDTVVRDGRPALETGRIDVWRQGFTLTHHPTRLTQKEFYVPGNVTGRYYREQEELIKRVYGAHTVVIVNNIVRNAGKADQRGNANPFAGGGNGVNGYANVVHTDFRAAKSVQKFYEQDPKHSGRARVDGRATYYERLGRATPGKYMLINTWRNISDEHPIYNNTLACCDQQTVSSPDDYCSVDVPLTAEAHAEQYRLWSHTAPRHAWFYFPHMMQDEVLMFTQFDSDTEAPARFCFHTAFNDPAVDPQLPQRESVEVRAIAFFAADWQQQQAMRLGLGGGMRERKAESTISGNVNELLKQLAQAASHGLLQASELPELVDTAAYHGAQNEEFILQLCGERGIEYRPHEWQPGPAADRMLEELSALKTFERANFLKPPKEEQPMDVSEDEARQDILNLQRMFPDLAGDAVVAVYRGFAGNFETAVEMLSLALAEGHEHVRGRF